MKSTQNQINHSHNEFNHTPAPIKERGSRFNKMILTLSTLVSLTGIGCSTPPVVEPYEDPSLGAWSAYESCVQALAPYGREAECANVNRNGQSMSYNQYMGTNDGSNSYYSDFSSESNPYLNYLQSLKPHEAEELQLEWTQLAEGSKQEG